MAVTSLVFTTTSFLVLAVISAFVPSLFVDFDDWLDQGDRYLGDEFWLVVSSVAMEVLLAVGIAALTAHLLSKRTTASTSPIAKTSVWYQALKGDIDRDKASWVLAELLDGTRVWGYVHYFTIQDIGDHRDISFKGPGLTIQPFGGDKQEEAYFIYYVVNSSQIRMLKIAHEGKKMDAPRRPAAVRKLAAAKKPLP